MKLCTEWSNYKYKRHFDSEKHKKEEAEWDSQGLQQSVLEEANAEAAAKEAERLAVDKTRAAAGATRDFNFRKRATAAFIAAGVPLNKLEDLRRWIESETKQSLGHHKELSRKYIKPLLEEEKKLQEMELKLADEFSIIFDATPRMGDFFALLTRRIVLNEDGKRAEALQTLIHLSALKGSLNADTLAGEVMKAFSNRGVSHERAVAAMNDGCFTNGAAHEVLSKVSEINDELDRFVSLCISHCASNAGKQAGFPTLNLFWTLIQKVVSHSEPAKVSEQ